MKKIHALALGILICMPAISMATTTTSLESPTPTVNVGLFGLIPNNMGNYATNIGESKTTVMKWGNTLDYGFTFNADLWQVNVGAGEQAKVDFNVIKNITAFSVNQTQNDWATFVAAGPSFSNLLGAGSYYFVAMGTVGAELVGSYSVATTVSAVPVPGAVWLMGTALAGLVAVRKRKS